MKLYEYQQQTIVKLEQLLTVKDKILVASPTGSGKTVISGQFLTNSLNKGLRCLFFAPRRKLVTQAFEKFSGLFNLNPSYMMAGLPYDPNNTLQCVSSDTFRVRFMSYKDIPPKFDIIIFDEAHLKTKSQKEIMDMFPGVKYVGFTATPCNKSGHGLGSLYEDIIESSNIETLIKSGHLVDYEFYAPYVPNMKGVKIVGDEWDQEESGERMKELTGDIIEHWLSHAHGLKTLAFCSSIKQSRYLTEEFRRVGVKAAHIDCYMPEHEKQELYSQFANQEIELLSNVQLLGVGFDDPSLEAILLCRPTKSYVNYLQIIGRGLRPSENKSKVLILDHSGTVYQHGLPERAKDWVLQERIEKKKAVKKKEKKEYEKLMRTCKVCKLIFEGKVCPACGEEVTLQWEAILIKEGRLEKLDKDMFVKAQKSEDIVRKKKQFMAKLLGYAEYKGFKPGWAFYKYRERFNEDPKFSVEAIPDDGEVVRWFKHLYFKTHGRRKAHYDRE